MWRLKLILFFIICLTVSFASAGHEVSLVDSEGDPLHEAVLMQFKTSAAEENTETDSEVHIMDQINHQFAPQLIVIKSGDFVNFPNSDNVRHHVYSFSPAKTFELALYEAGTSPDMAFSTQGIVVVGCNIHDQMRGHIVVAGTERYRMSDKNGLFSFPDEWVNHGDWFVWHPWMSDQGLKPQPVDLNEWVGGESETVVTIPVTKPMQEQESELERRFRRGMIRGGN